jgi:N-acyl-D-amino-acid deacylase
MDQMNGGYVIKGGLVHDGTGAPPKRLDVAVEGGFIADVGRGLDGGTVIDATGLAVTPGFIDIHTHYDAQVMWDRALTSSCWHGVTSVVMGNCGFSLAPCRPSDRELIFATLERAEDMSSATLAAGVRSDFETFGEYLGAIERLGTVVNVGGYVGHTTAAIYVMGDEAYERNPTSEELARIAEVVRDSIRGGALGFSSTNSRGLLGAGGRILPSALATLEELRALLRVAGDVGFGVNALSPGNDFSWLYDFQAENGAKITWNSILSFPEGTSAFRPWDEKLAMHSEGRNVSGQVWAQVTCRPIVSQITMADPAPLSRAPAFAALQRGTRQERIDAYRSPAWRDAAWAELESTQFVNPRWDTFIIDESPRHSRLLQRSVQDVARERGQRALDVLLDVSLDDDLATRFRVVFANDDEAAIVELLRAEGCVLGLSDAGAHIGQQCDASMPTDFLGNWVRSRDVMSPERGIRKLTGELADLYDLPDRGYLEPGMRADIVLVDLDRVDPGPIRRVRDLPAGGERLVADAPSGIERVIVNGVPVIASNELLVAEDAELPGEILRPGKRER